MNSVLPQSSPSRSVSGDLIGGIPLFADLGETERADLRRLLQPRHFESQQPVFWIGEDGNEFYIVESGKVVICYPDESGQEVTLAVLGPGHFFGELSLLDGGRRTATARTQEGTRLLALGRDQFHDFIKRHPAASIHVLTELGRRQRDNIDKLRGIKNCNEVVEEQQTPFQKVLERVTAIFAGEVFLICNLAFFILWILVQTYFYRQASAANPQRFPPVTLLDQPPTFFWLNFLVALEAIILSIFVLNAQRRQAQRDSIKADLDYQVNRKAQLEIMRLHEKIDRLQSSQDEQRASEAEKR